MSTKIDKLVTGPQANPLESMPPLTVVTDGIPAQEHLEAPDAVEAPQGAARRRRDRRAVRFALAAAGMLGLGLLAGLVIVLRPTPVAVDGTLMGLDARAWQAYRADERASTTGLHMGLTLPAWQGYRAQERSTPGRVSDRMGLSIPDWQAVRRGEHAAPVTVSPVGHLGLDGFEWAQFRGGERAARSGAPRTGTRSRSVWWWRRMLSGRSDSSAPTTTTRPVSSPSRGCMC